MDDRPRGSSSRDGRLLYLWMSSPVEARSLIRPHLRRVVTEPHYPEVDVAVKWRGPPPRPRRRAWALAVDCAPAVAGLGLELERVFGEIHHAALLGAEVGAADELQRAHGVVPARLRLGAVEQDVEEVGHFAHVALAVRGVPRPLGRPRWPVR